MYSVYSLLPGQGVVTSPKNLGLRGPWGHRQGHEAAGSFRAASVEGELGTGSGTS